MCRMGTALGRILIGDWEYLCQGLTSKREEDSGFPPGCFEGSFSLQDHWPENSPPELG